MKNYRYILAIFYFTLFIYVSSYTTTSLAQRACSRVEHISISDYPQLTIAAFGGAEVEVKTMSPLPEVSVKAKTNANVRNGPSTDATILTSLRPSQNVQAIARNADGSWIRIVLPDSRKGWVAATVVTVSGDLFELPEQSSHALSHIEADIVLQISTSETCADVHGIVVHAPFPNTWHSIAVNGFVLKFVGTLHLTAESDRLLIQVPSGLLKIEVSELTVLEGSQVSISSDGVTSEVVPYAVKEVEETSQYLCENSELFSLDQGCFLTIAQPLDEAKLTAAEALQAPLEGEWLQTVVQDEPITGSSACPAPYYFSPGTIVHTFLESNEDATVVHQGIVNYTRLQRGIYQWAERYAGSTLESELRVVTPLQATLKIRRDYDTGCTIMRQYNLEYYRPFPILPVLLPLPLPGLWQLEITDVDVNPVDCRPRRPVGFTRVNMMYPQYGGLKLGPNTYGYVISPGIYYDFTIVNVGSQQEHKNEGFLTISSESKVLLLDRDVENACEEITNVEFRYLEALDTVENGTWSVSIDPAEDTGCMSSQVWFVNQETFQLTYTSDRIELFDSERGTSIFVRDIRIRDKLEPNLFEFSTSIPTVTKIVRLEILSETEIRLEENVLGRESLRSPQCQNRRTATLRYLSQP